MGGLRQLGHAVEVRPLRRRSGFHTFDRWRYNGDLVREPPVADLVIGVDLDGFRWARRRRAPFVVCLKGIIADELRHERGWVRILLGVQARWERRNCARADLVVVTSRYQAAVAGEAYGVEPDRLAVVPEPIDLEAWRRGLGAARRRPRRGPVVLAVARMYARKRLADLLDAAARLRGEIEGLQVRIVGRGPEWESLRALHARLALGDTVVFLGDVSPEQLHEEYANADVLCLPSVQEGFGIVFLEAMAASIPIVACRAAAIPEVVRDGETGLLTAPRDPAGLAAAVRALLDDPERARRLGRAGALRVEAFALAPVARAFLDAVESRVGPVQGGDH